MTGEHPCLYGFPPAGGGSPAYRPWQPLLAPIEVRPLVWPGREHLLGQPPLRDVDALVACALGEVDARRPFALFGHSLGALVAFEVARALRRQGIQPLALFVSAFRAPQLPPTQAPLHRLPDRELVRELERYNGTPPEILAHEELLALLLPSLRADVEAAETYAYRTEAPLACPILAFGGDDDPFVSREELAAWRAQTTGPFRVRTFPGDHFYLQASHAALLAAVRAALLP